MSSHDKYFVSEVLWSVTRTISLPEIKLISLSVPCLLGVVGDSSCVRHSLMKNLSHCAYRPSMQRLARSPIPYADNRHIHICCDWWERYVQYEHHLLLFFFFFIFT